MQIKNIILSIAALAVVNAAPAPAAPGPYEACKSISYDSKQAFDSYSTPSEQRDAIFAKCKACVDAKQVCSASSSTDCDSQYTSCVSSVTVQ